ncbi:unnamed protein product [Parnassius apollo]|uniref:(apollo) hypothetical protein n=1 Tax=Parnassius apollo TaxID=110799 RepID=A0A8S3WBV6_PARAO|nr:unnamed protein product [Parnassius apollo]
MKNQSLVWVNFIEVSNKASGKTGCRAECRKCGKSMQGLVNRLKKHLKTCNTDVLPNPSKEHSCSNSEHVENELGPPLSPGPSPSKKRKLEPKPIASYFSLTTSEQKEKLDKQIARAMFATNCPF